jgi:predicted Zn-dependent peptidase
VRQGDYHRLFSAEARVEAVTAADIQRVARKTFRADNRVSGHVLKA